MELAEYFIKYKITARQFAEKVGYCLATIQHIRTKKTVPSLRLAKIISEATDGQVTIEDLGVVFETVVKTIKTVRVKRGCRKNK